MTGKAASYVQGLHGHLVEVIPLHLMLVIMHCAAFSSKACKESECHINNSLNIYSIFLS